MLTGNEKGEVWPTGSVSQLNYVETTNDPTILLLARAYFPHSCFCPSMQLCSAPCGPHSKMCAESTACAQEAGVLGAQGTEQCQTWQWPPKPLPFPTHVSLAKASHMTRLMSVGQKVLSPCRGRLARDAPGRVRGERLCDLKITIRYVPLSVFFWRQVLGSLLGWFIKN